MKCIITGGAGFIGSNLAEKLVQLDHKVIIIDNLSTGKIKNLKNIKNKIKFINHDISKDTEKFRSYFNKVDWVFHLAGLADILPSIKEPTKYFKANVEGTLNVINASKNKKIKKLVYAASASCYGLPKKFPTDENSKIDTRYPYALTKYLGEKLVLDWSKIYKANNVSLRFFNVYGPKSRTTGAYGAVFGVFLAQKLFNKPLTIVGDGKQTRDFVHVYDLVSGLIQAAKKGKPGEIYNIGSGKEVSVNYIAKLIAGKKIFIPKRPGEPERSLACIKKIKKNLKWKPKISIEKGINELLRNKEHWLDAPVWTEKKIQLATKEWFKNLK
jgi:UDP-glucose 4-epimerase